MAVFLIGVNLKFRHRRRDENSAFDLKSQKIAAFGSSYMGTQSDVGAAEGCDLFVFFEYRSGRVSAPPPRTPGAQVFKNKRSKAEQPDHRNDHDP
ncbi:hypothetical protein HNO86_06665 [Pseudomonas sp. C1C7]|uniref:hypothetical protein n=1 Tax=Pseudomonas sp. C1C7 TaxID=2735272 RepID=UPI0015868344|nr:hypothetical protein [Pseudomonas sp. C1C7]NUT74722.1 hypothetical protein [Pseudomonas sp. C1C7]